jgi:hypothetical protein
MVVKIRDASGTETHSIRAAGAKAEDQMAFYLSRAFKNSSNILIFNDLRLPSSESGDFGQIDHLILHPGGFVIVESKNVASVVKVNERGEWTRFWNKEWHGMASPVQQAKRQADFLREILQEKKAELRSKALFGILQKGFGQMPIDVLIAISDDGRIERSGVFDEVLKSDQITDRIREIIKKRSVSFLAVDDDEPWASLASDEIDRIKSFLLTIHRPLSLNSPLKNEYQPEPSSETSGTKGVSHAPIRTDQRAPKTAPILSEITAIPPAVETHQSRVTVQCKHCKSSELSIEYGFNYYYRCSKCAKSTAIEYGCPQCGSDARLRKEQRKFFKECKCGYSALFHINSDAANFT